MLIIATATSETVFLVSNTPATKLLANPLNGLAFCISEFPK